MSHDHKIKRRDFLIGASAAAGTAAMFMNPVEMLLKSMTKGMITQAQASLTGQPRNYVNVLLAGAPSRYVFDQWVRINPNESLVFNPMVTTKYTSSDATVSGLEYSTFNYNNVMVPHMFSHSVSSGDGSQRPLTDLLKNALIIRGYGSGLDGHPFNAQQQQAPIGGVSSISGAAADYSKKYFAAIQWPDRGAAAAYTSMEGKALNKATGNNPLSSLMEGFGPAAQPLARNLRERHQAAFDDAAAVLKSFAGSPSFGAAALNANLDNAFALMKKGVAGITGYWDPAVARYKGVIEASMRASGLLGISDKTILSNESNQYNVNLGDGTSFIVAKDFDVRVANTTMTAPACMAEGFALAEYMIRENLGTSVELQLPDIPNVSLARMGSPVAQHVLHNDMHETGAMISLLVCTAYYRGLSAAILELSRSLGAAHWENTVLQVLGDFARSARANGSGSDHGFNQMVTSVYSGCLTNGPYVVGNIKKSGPGGGYEGTQGVGASIDGYNQRGMPTPTMAASTVAALLNLEKNPFENIAAPLVKLDGSGLKILAAAKLKEE